MALTPLERKRRQLEKQEVARRKTEDLSYPYLSIPFFEYIQSGEEEGNFMGVEIAFDYMNLSAPQFNDDSGPKSQTGSFEKDDPEVYAAFKGSIGRAEHMVDMLLAAAHDLALTVATYKNREITARIAELEASDLSDPDTKKQALADIVKLTKIRDQLSKQVRWTLPEWKVKGE